MINDYTFEEVVKLASIGEQVLINELKSKPSSNKKYAGALLMRGLGQGLKALGKTRATATVGDALKVLRKHVGAREHRLLDPLVSIQAALPKSARPALQGLIDKTQSARNLESALGRNHRLQDLPLRLVSDDTIKEFMRPRSSAVGIYGPKFTYKPTDSILEALNQTDRLL